jgi:hypothetical protein
MSPTEKELDPTLPLDPYLEGIIQSLPKSNPVQYSTRDQMLYLARLAAKLGLYGAQDYINQRLLDWTWCQKSPK